MPTWNEVLIELSQVDIINPLDSVRRKYLNLLHEKTSRNVIAYYSSFIDRQGVAGIEINDSDINAFMAVVHKLDPNKGLDLILHTPGGGLAAAESLVCYLKKIFGNDIRAIVPQISMSAGTMIACSCKSIMMGKQSSIGPIDPQFGGIPAQGVIEEFEKAIAEVKRDPATLEIWRTVISKYPPTFIGECNNAIKLSKEIVTSWLEKNMFLLYDDKKKRAHDVVDLLSDHNGSKMHDRHIDAVEAKRIGLVIEDMESDNELQDKILTVHHAFMHTIGNSNIKKIVENHLGVAQIQHIPPK